MVAAAPDIAGEQQIVGLAGRAPSPGKRPNGCAFSVRCESVTDDCLGQFPQSVSISQSHFARCINIRKSETSAKPESIKLVKKASSNTVLELRNISAGYGGQSVVEEISLILGRGQCLALVGESGSGKTTVARCIGGLHTEWSGEIFLNNEKLNRGSRQRRIEQRLGIQYIFQNPYGSLNPRRTVGDSIIRPLIISGSTGSTVKKELNEVLEKVSLPSAYSDKFPDQLSGGERQRVAIARALISRPDVLVCDEITSALDVLVQAAVVDLLATLQRDLGLAILFITHNLPLVRSIADEVAVMSDGKVVEFGDTATVIGHPVQEYTQRLISATPSIARSSK